jgi:hypothetical protein
VEANEYGTSEEGMIQLNIRKKDRIFKKKKKQR